MGPYCKFCDQRCFIPMPAGTPREILAAYGTSTIVATCPAGKRFEKERVGYCLDDIRDRVAHYDEASHTLHVPGRGQYLIHVQTARYITAAPPNAGPWPGPDGDVDAIAAAGWVIFCIKCQRISHHPGDVLHRYCGNCHEFLDPGQPTLPSEVAL